MSYSCTPEGCNFGPDNWGVINLSGTPNTPGTYEIPLSAVVTLDGTPLGLAGLEIPIPIPYNGEVTLLNIALGNDFSGINSFLPTVVLNVEESADVLTITSTVCNPQDQELRLTGPNWDWDPNAGPIADDNGDGTYTFTFDPAPDADMTYLLVLDGVQEDLVAANADTNEVDNFSCTPITDYYSYANRQWSIGDDLNVTNIYGTCGTCDDNSYYFGCTDSTAANYDPNASGDDGSCILDAGTLQVTATVCNYTSLNDSSVRLTGPWWSWDPTGGPVGIDNGDGTYTFTFDPAPTSDMEYLLVLDGVMEDIVSSNYDENGDALENADWSCTPVTDYWSYANRKWSVGSGDVSGITYGSCSGSCPDLPSVEGNPFVDELFSDVSVTSNVVYGNNIGIITQAPAAEDLLMDVYQPVGDDATDRRVMLLLHTGTFLPPIANGQATGDKSDNFLVELATRYAKKGYVVGVPNYRLGWNPLTPDPDARTQGLAHALYRALQDTRTAVRFFRKSAAEDGNPYGVGDKFVVGGEGTGGYISYGVATLNNDAELLLPKIINSSPETIAQFGQPVPYILQSMMGDINGTNFGSMMMDMDGDGTPETDVPFCLPNHVGYSSDVDMVFALGGANIDTLWQEAGEVPMAAMQNPMEEFAPYGVGILTEPVNNQPVIEAMGAKETIRKATELGNNDIFEGLSTTLTDNWYGNGDGAANSAFAGHANYSGLFPIVTPEPPALTPCGIPGQWGGSPWQWWDNATYGPMGDAYNGLDAGSTVCSAMQDNPDMSEAKSLAFTDMIEEYMTPRIYAALDLVRERYTDELFSDVSVTSNVVYGNNIGIITQAPAAEDLLMDVYQPVGDDATDRRVMLLLHTGTFLPPIANGQATGDKSDNFLVELATRYAKKGYVVGVPNYRLGWNPLTPDPDARTQGLAHALYRALQDTRTAVRFFRKSAAEDGNPYGVGDKFVVGGEGTGGYISYGVATLNNDAELLLPKIINSSPETIAQFGQPVPYILQSMMGDINGTNFGSMMMDMDGDGTPETDVPFCLPNHVGYSSDVDMVFALGGANIDTLWQEAGEVPMAAMQNPMEEFAPYGVGILTEPVNNQPVIEAMGAKETIRKATELGNNDIFEGLSTTLTDNWYGNGDGAANSAFAGHANYSGLFPIVTPEPPALTPCGIPGQWGGSPWQWWDNATYGPMGDAYNGLDAGSTVCSAMQDNPDMSEAKSLAFTDMIEEYMTPRINAAMSVDASEINVVLGCTDPNATNFDPFANTSDESCEFVVGPTEQNVNLPTGWCMFSTYMLNDNMSADAILSEIVDRVVIAKDYLGAAYLSLIHI